MKKLLQRHLGKCLETCRMDGILTSDHFPEPLVEVPHHSEHGDFASNIAMLLAKSEKKPPRLLADGIVARLRSDTDLFEKVEVAGPGFINFFLNKDVWRKTLEVICASGDEYGKSTIGQGKKVQVEFVSANPTGPLHIGHGRGAATGDAIASILSAAGFHVVREYYINDAGNQMDTLGRSVYLRYRELLGERVEFPQNCYQGDYIKDIARDLIAKHGSKYLETSEEDAVSLFAKIGGDIILKGIQQDLRDFGVVHDTWFSEQSLFDSGKVQESIAYLKDKGVLYENDGALWFRTTQFGDDKDRVVVRGNGVTTYFA